MNKFLNLEYQYHKLIKSLDKLKDKNKIISALNLAKKAHAGQKRDEGQNFIIHPTRIANCLITELLVKDPDLIIAGILHDVIEDSDTTLAEIQEEFGNEVKTLVKKITRNPDKETKMQKFKKLMKESDRLRLLKAVDRLDNMRSLPFRTDRGERFRRHIREIYQMNLPLAKSVSEYVHSEMLRVLKKLNLKLSASHSH